MRLFDQGLRKTAPTRHVLASRAPKERVNIILTSQRVVLQETERALSLIPSIDVSVYVETAIRPRRHPKRMSVFM